MGYKMSSINSNSLYDRVNKLLVSFEWSDCSFSVSNRKFKAHKLILGISSPVFEAMFYGPLSSNDDILITDVEPEIFQLMLNYIYTDKVDISSIEESYELLYVSRKYLLEHLSDICVSYIQSNMTVDNIITILNYSDYMQDNKLVDSALTLLCGHASYVLQEENLENISVECMKKIVQCDNMNVSEESLIKYVFKWTLYQCKENYDSTEFEKRRSIFLNNDLFKHLRFTVLSLEQLNEIINDKDNLLLPYESDNIRYLIENFNSSGKRVPINCLTTISVPRNPIMLQWRLCYRSPLRSMSPATIDAHNNCIQTRLKANKPVFINSLIVPSRMAPEQNFYNSTSRTNIYCENFNVLVTSDSENSSISKQFSINKSIEYDSNCDVEFVEPLILRKDQWYTIRFAWRESTYNSYSYAVQSRERSYNSNTVEFEFEDLILPNENGGSFLKSLTFCM